MKQHGPLGITSGVNSTMLSPDMIFKKKSVDITSGPFPCQTFVVAAVGDIVLLTKHVDMPLQLSENFD
jgi:hypothetical protein